MQITLAQAAQYSGCRKDLHRLMKADNWYLPSENSSLVTVEFLRDVRAGKVMCPKASEIKLKQCAHPPKIELLIEFLISGLTAHFQKLFATADQKQAGANLIKLLEKKNKKPDQKWCLAMLSTYFPSCEIFNKSYRPPKKDEQDDYGFPRMNIVDNEDGLFNEVDVLARNKYKGIRSSLFLSKEE